MFSDCMARGLIFLFFWRVLCTCIVKTVAKQSVRQKWSKRGEKLFYLVLSGYIRLKRISYTETAEKKNIFLLKNIDVWLRGKRTISVKIRLEWNPGQNYPSLSGSDQPG